MHQGRGSRNEFQAAGGGGGGPPAELTGEDYMYEYHDSLSPLPGTLPHEEWAGQ